MLSSDVARKRASDERIRVTISHFLIGFETSNDRQVLVEPTIGTNHLTACGSHLAECHGIEEVLISHRARLEGGDPSN